MYKDVITTLVNYVLMSPAATISVCIFYVQLLGAAMYKLYMSNAWLVIDTDYLGSLKIYNLYYECNFIFFTKCKINVGAF
jgi:hypothetical protein